MAFESLCYKPKTKKGGIETCLFGPSPFEFALKRVLITINYAKQRCVASQLIINDENLLRQYC